MLHWKRKINRNKIILQKRRLKGQREHNQKNLAIFTHHKTTKLSYEMILWTQPKNQVVVKHNKKYAPVKSCICTQ
jgi:hypothetical protein